MTKSPKQIDVKEIRFLVAKSLNLINIFSGLVEVDYTRGKWEANAVLNYHIAIAAWFSRTEL